MRISWALHPDLFKGAVLESVKSKKGGMNLSQGVPRRDFPAVLRDREKGLVNSNSLGRTGKSGH